MHPCLRCGTRIAAADAEHRYCPYCGVVRVLPDPLESATLGGLLVVGRDAIGPRSGQVYGYFKAGAAPSPLHPLSGPFQNEGRPLQSLSASSGQPLPESSLNVWGWNGSRPEFRNPHHRTWSSGFSLTGAVARHGRVYSHQRPARAGMGGQVTALRSEKLDLVPGWRFPTWAGELQGSIDASETLLYGTFVVGAGGAELRAVDLGRGEPQFTLRMPFRQPRCVISGDGLLILGETPDRIQPARLYRLEDFLHQSSPLPREQGGVPVTGPPQNCLPAPVRLGDRWLFAGLDGRLYQWWEGAGPDPQALWPNPLQAKHLLPQFVPLGEKQLGCLVRLEGRAPQLVVLEPAGEDFRVSGTVELPSLSYSRCQRVCGTGGQLFLVVQNPGQSLQLYRQRLDGTAPAQLFQSLTGTEEAEVHGVQLAPWSDHSGPALLIHTTYRTRHDVWLVHPDTGAMETPSYHPVSAHAVRLFWQTGGVWAANLDLGEITQLF